MYRRVVDHGKHAAHLRSQFPWQPADYPGGILFRKLQVQPPMAFKNSHSGG